MGARFNPPIRQERTLVAGAVRSISTSRSRMTPSRDSGGRRSPEFIRDGLAPAPFLSGRCSVLMIRTVVRGLYLETGVRPADRVGCGRERE